MAHDVFISYSSKDKKIVLAVSNALEAEKIRCWYAERDIPAGADWPESIVNAIQEAQVLLLIFTDFSNSSKHVSTEVHIAISDGKPVIPFKLTPNGPTEGMKYYLEKVHWLDAVDQPLEDAIDKLVDRVKKYVDMGTNVPQNERLPDGFVGENGKQQDENLSHVFKADTVHHPADKTDNPVGVGSAVEVGGLFSKLFRRKRNQKKAEAKPAPCSDTLGNTEAINTADLPATKPLRTVDVEFSALFPKRFIKGEYSILEMYIYERDQREILDEALRAANAALKESRGSTLRIGEESVVSIRLECANSSVQIEGNEECQVWHGKYLKFDFAIFLEESCPKRQLLFTAMIFINSVPATRLRFTAECSTLREQKLELLREDVLSAFVSYASQDRSRVAAIIQGMKKARPEMDVFFDVDSLRSGEDWQQALRAEIERRDILFLCWSLSAKQSEWVDREWRYALENKGLGFIEPVPLDPPNICPPPKELSSKHFNDRGLLYISR